MSFPKTRFGTPLPLLLWWTALSVRLSSSSDILQFYVLEELAPRRVVGNIAHDFRFDERYDEETVASLRFSVLKQPAFDRRFFAVNETSGVVETTHRIDRELICRGDDECVVKFDVAVKPMQYFQIIKVRSIQLNKYLLECLLALKFIAHFFRLGIEGCRWANVTYLLSYFLTYLLTYFWCNAWCSATEVF